MKILDILNLIKSLWTYYYANMTWKLYATSSINTLEYLEYMFGPTNDFLAVLTSPFDDRQIWLSNNEIKMTLQKVIKFMGQPVSVLYYAYILYAI